MEHRDLGSYDDCHSCWLREETLIDLPGSGHHFVSVDDLSEDMVETPVVFLVTFVWALAPHVAPFNE